MEMKISSPSFKCYNITGKEIDIKLNEYDPLYNNVWLPAKVVDEYPKFLIVEILPHLNVNEHVGISKPYRLGINKMSINFKEVEIRECD